jgi:hypothetical protein
MKLRIATLAVAALLSAPAMSQNHIVVTKTLTSNSAHRECLAVTDKQMLRYWYRADGPVDFNIQYVDGKNTVVPVKQAKQSLGTGSYAPKTAGDYCMVWTNNSKQPVLFRFELARIAR